jgi:hypothetical protein
VQRAIGKGLPMGWVPAAVGESLRRGMEVTASFIIGFPEEEMADVARTLRLAVSLLFGRTQGPALSLHLLTPLAGSPLLDGHGGELGFDGVFSDLVTPILSPGDGETIRARPRLFSAYHHFPTPHLSRSRLTRLPFLFLNLFQLRYTLFWFWKTPDSGFPDSFLAHPLLTALPWRSRQESVQEILADLDRVIGFLREVVGARKLESPLLEALIAYDRAMVRAGLSGSALERFEVDAAGAVESIRAGGFTALPADSPPRPSLLYFRREKRRVTVRRITDPWNSLQGPIGSVSGPG